ncbi:MAG: hypothetical protein ABL958_16960 [Bdellovibrionia bacterium]
MKRSRTFPIVILTLLFVVMVGAFNNCSGGHRSGGPLAEPVERSNEATKGGNPITQSTDLVIPSFGNENFEEIRFCMDRIRVNNGSDWKELTLSNPQIILTPAGGTIGKLDIPLGNYSRIEMDFAARCGLNYSIQVASSKGLYGTKMDVELRFDISYSTSQGPLQLPLQEIAEELARAKSNSDIDLYLRAMGADVDAP